MFLCFFFVTYTFSPAELSSERGEKEVLADSNQPTAPPSTKSHVSYCAARARRREKMAAEGTSSTTGADSICPERARSAGSRTALAPLQFRKMGCQNERKKLAQIRYQVTCYGIKLESGDLPRFFMIDEIDHARLEKKTRQTVCVREFVRTQWF